MEPAAVFGTATAAITLIAKMVPTLLSLKEQWDGIKHIDETNTGFLEELDAFQFSLAMIDVELRKPTLPPETRAWWDPDRITGLLTNATKTVTRLDAVFGNVSRKRNRFQSIRSYYRASMYEREIGHLMLRVRTYTTCLSLPATLVAM
jgi:hypothetical protein